MRFAAGSKLLGGVVPSGTSVEPCMGDLFRPVRSFAGFHECDVGNRVALS